MNKAMKRKRVMREEIGHPPAKSMLSQLNPKPLINHRKLGGGVLRDAIKAHSRMSSNNTW